MPPRSHKPLHLLFAALLYAFFGLFLLWPMAQVLIKGFTSPSGNFTFAYIFLIFKDRALLEGLINATVIAVSVTLLTILIATPLAVLSVRYDFPGRSLLNGLLLVPLILPPFVGAIGMRVVLGRFGPFTQLTGGGGPDGTDWMGQYRLLGIVLVEALHLYPIMLLNLQASLANIDPAMEQSAANIGASRWTVFRRITVPLMRPGLFAGSTLVLIWSFTELGTPLVFEYFRCTPVQIFKQITDVASNPLPFALVVVTLIASVGLYVVGKVILGRSYDSATSKATVASTPKLLRGQHAAAAITAFVAVFLLAALPHVAVLFTSFSEVGAWYRSVLPTDYTLAHYHHALVDELAMPSIYNSIKYATLATGVAVLVGLAAAVVIVRSDLPGRGVIDALCMLPLAVPGLVLAFGYLAISVWFRKQFPDHTGPGGKLDWLNVQENPAVLLVIAYAARRMPYVVRSAVAGLQQTPRDLELAGENLGAPRRTVFSRITVPLIAGNLVAGALIAFAFAMLEVSDSLVLAQRYDYFPITKAILDLAQRLGDGLYIACALGVWAMVLLTLTLLAANAFLGKRLGAIFRV